MIELYPWQQSDWRHFEDMVSSQRLAHGFVLGGPRGLGKRRFAEAISSYLLCTAELARPCGSCKSCRLVAADNHPDLMVLQPEDDSRQIRVEQVRGLIERASLASQQHGYKAIIIDPAEAMNLNAQNSLLKTLEEPTAGTVLLLVTSQPASLAPTIISRCQQMRFRVPDRSVALQWLQTQGQADWASLLEISGQAPLAATELHAAGADGLAEELATHITGLIEGRHDPVEIAEQWGREDLVIRLRWLQLQVYGLVRWKSGLGAELVHKMVLKSLQKLAPDTSVKSIFHYLDALQRAIRLTDKTINQTLAVIPLLAVWSDGPRFERIENESS